MSLAPHLLTALESSDANLRNNSALALMDSGDRAAIPVLLAAIENPAHRHARGTLVYALSAFDCTGLFAELFRWAIEGAYETTGEALAILHEQALQADAISLPICQRLLQQAEANLAPELLDELRDILRQDEG